MFILSNGAESSMAQYNNPKSTIFMNLMKEWYFNSDYMN